MSDLSLNEFSLPLKSVTDNDIRGVLHCLWRWQSCSDCQDQVRCSNANCSYSRYTRLRRYIQFYHQTTAFYDPEVTSGSHTVLSTHEDLCSLITRIKAKTNVPRRQLIQELFGTLSVNHPGLAADREQALDLAVRVMTMVDTSGQIHGIRSVEDGLVPVRWSNDETFVEYMSDLFPQTHQPAVNKENASLDSDFVALIKAPMLQKQTGLKFRPTNNLHNHLKLDRDTRSVEIFHQTSFLKEYLRNSRDKGDDKHVVVNADWEDGVIPRQLALEVLDSIQKIIFPLTDQKSKRILQTLVSRWNLDPDCLRFDSASIRSPEEQNLTYRYFGARLADLHEEAQNPKPYGYLEEWLERRSGARYVMLATLIGVAIAILLGVLALIVSIYQAYIGYMAWQHPVSNS